MRSIRICRMLALIDWRRREIGAARVRSLGLVVANSTVWRRCIVMAILIGRVGLAVLVVTACKRVSIHVLEEVQSSVLTSIFAGIALSLSVLVIRIASSTHSTSSESGFC